MDEININFIQIDTSKSSIFPLINNNSQLPKIVNSNHFDFFLILEIWKHHILIYLDFRTLKRLRSVNRSFFRLINSIYFYGIVFENFKKFSECCVDSLVSFRSKIYSVKTLSRRFNKFELMKFMNNDIKEIQIQFSKMFRDEDFQYLPSWLEKFALTYCEGLTDEGLKNLPRNLIKLEIIIDPKLNKITKSIFRYLPQNLKELFLHGIEILDNDLEYLPPQLTKLRMSNGLELSNKGLKLLPTTLQYLDITCTYKLDWTEETTKSLPQGLTHLIICQGTRFDESSFLLLPSTLLNLEFTYCTLTGKGFFLLPTCLKNLKVTGYYISDELLCNLNGINIIHTLDISYNDRISNSSIKKLPTSITKLGLCLSNYLTSEALLSISSSVKNLNLRCQNNIVESSQIILSRIPTFIKDLQLNNFKIENAAIKYLSSSIQYLQMYETKIDEQSLQSLPKDLTNLSFIFCKEIKDNHLISLPTTLTTLSLNCLLIDGSCFQYFPSSLTQLNINELKNITNQVFKFLPSSIQDLFLWKNNKLNDLCLNFISTSLISLKITEQSTIEKKKIQEWKKKYKIY